MLDDLFDLFERDKKHANQRQTGLRGRLSSMLAGGGTNRPGHAGIGLAR